MVVILSEDAPNNPLYCGHHPGRASALVRGGNAAARQQLSSAKQKAAGICALRLAGFENLVFMKAYPAPGDKSEAQLHSDVNRNEQFRSRNKALVAV